MIKKKVVLSFPPKVTEEPITYHLIADYGLMVNILRATIDPGKKGKMVIELKGEESELSRGLNYLERSGVLVDPFTSEIRYLEEKCTNCTACVPICPTAALNVDRATMVVSYDAEKCVVCGSCVTVCPYKAVEMS